MTDTRCALARQALDKALEVREQVGVAFNSPICIYALCDKLKIKVQFTAIDSMEGMYVAGKKPLILLSSLRPLPRRVFTCGHELGHHVFGHGSAIDELKKEAAANPTFDPKEFLVNAFSGFLLMPQLAVRKAFRLRGWDPKSPTPEQVFTVACSLGVGYETLVNHMQHSINEIPGAHASALAKTTLPAIRRTILGRPSNERLIVADKHHQLGTLDVEVGAQVLLPAGVVPEVSSLVAIEDQARGRLFRAHKPGLVRVHNPADNWAIVVRISRYQYVGLSKFRHLEEVENDEE